jgi:hypothetical protein
VTDRYRSFWKSHMYYNPPDVHSDGDGYFTILN